MKKHLLTKDLGWAAQGGARKNEVDILPDRIWMERLESNWLKFGKILEKTLQTQQNQMQVSFQNKSKYLSGNGFFWVKPTGMTLRALNWYFQWGRKEVEEAHGEADEVTQDGQGMAAPT